MSERPTPETDAVDGKPTWQEDIIEKGWVPAGIAHRLERERDEARKELDALKATIAKSGLIEVEATTCIADKCGKPTIVKNGMMLVHKDEKLRMQQRTVDLQKHAATARKLAAERALADRLAKALLSFCSSGMVWPNTDTPEKAIAAWKEARSE